MVTLISSASDNALCTSVSNIGKNMKVKHFYFFWVSFLLNYFKMVKGYSALLETEGKWLHSKELFHLIGEKLIYILGL